MKSSDVRWDHFRKVSFDDWVCFRKRVPTLMPPPGCDWVLSPLGGPVEVRGCTVPNLRVCCMSSDWPPSSRVIEKAHDGLKAEHYARIGDWTTFVQVLDERPEAVRYILELEPWSTWSAPEVAKAKDYARQIAARREALEIARELDAEPQKDAPQWIPGN